MSGLIQVKIPSETQDHKLYSVRLTPKGWRCDCPAFVFSKNDTCKHQKTAEGMYQDFLGDNALEDI